MSEESSDDLPYCSRRHTDGGPVGRKSPALAECSDGLLGISSTVHIASDSGVALRCYLCFEQRVRRSGILTVSPNNLISKWNPDSALLGNARFLNSGHVQTSLPDKSVPPLGKPIVGVSGFCQVTLANTVIADIFDGFVQPFLSKEPAFGRRRANNPGVLSRVSDGRWANLKLYYYGRLEL
jgi:hypothetical protein